MPTKGVIAKQAIYTIFSLLPNAKFNTEGIETCDIIWHDLKIDVHATGYKQNEKFLVNIRNTNKPSDFIDVVVGCEKNGDNHIWIVKDTKVTSMLLKPTESIAPGLLQLKLAQITGRKIS